jgi:hypothetical protein
MPAALSGVERDCPQNIDPAGATCAPSCAIFVVTACGQVAEDRGMEFVIGWIFLATLVGLWAGRRGRDGAAWGAIAIVVSPLIAWLTLLAIGPIVEE